MGQAIALATDAGTCGQLGSREFWVAAPGLEATRAELNAGIEMLSARDASEATPLAPCRRLARQSRG